MPLSENSDLKTISVILTKDQIRRLHAMREARSKPTMRVSFQDICRETVEAGLDAIHRAPNMISPTSTDEGVAA